MGGITLKEQLGFLNTFSPLKPTFSENGQFLPYRNDSISQGERLLP